jgi:hypothetical protein
MAAHNKDPYWETLAMDVFFNQGIYIYIFYVFVVLVVHQDNNNLSLL